MRRFLHKYGTRPNEIRRAKRELYGRLSLAALAVIILLMIIVVTRLQPRLPDSPNAAAETPTPESESEKAALRDTLRQEVDRLYAQFHEMTEDPADAVENIGLIEQAIQLQNEIIRLRTGTIASREDTQRLEELTAVRDGAMGDYLIAQSLREEEQALAAWREGDHENAKRCLNKAIIVQEQINEQYPHSSHRDSSRTHQLASLLLVWETKPIAEDADHLKARAYELVAQHKFAEARKTIRLATQKQETLMEDYRKSIYSTLNRMRAFEEAQMEIDAAEDKHNVELLLGLSKTRLESGDFKTALARVEEALVLQESLMLREGMDTRENLEKLESITRLRDTAAGMPVFKEIQKSKAATRRALLNRDMSAFQNSLANWYRETRSFQRRFPGSSQLQAENLNEVELLYDLRSDIPVIFEMVYGNLLRLPANPNLYMSRTEVSQALYESVMGGNPSSRKDPMLPVDSVTWKEAGEFANRLGTVLACPVVLPTQLLFNSALGTVRPEHIKEQSWSSENSNRLVQHCGQKAANQAGFHDLLGNVAEWLSGASGSIPDEVVAIGGSARDSRARLATIPEEWRSPDERNRYIGFRFVVDRQHNLK